MGVGWLGDSKSWRSSQCNGFNTGKQCCCTNRAVVVNARARLRVFRQLDVSVSNDRRQKPYCCATGKRGCVGRPGRASIVLKAFDSPKSDTS